MTREFGSVLGEVALDHLEVEPLKDRVCRFAFEEEDERLADELRRIDAGMADLRGERGGDGDAVGVPFPLYIRR